MGRSSATSSLRREVFGRVLERFGVVIREVYEGGPEPTEKKPWLRAASGPRPIEELGLDRFLSASPAPPAAVVN